MFSPFYSKGCLQPAPIAQWRDLKEFCGEKKQSGISAKNLQTPKRLHTL